MVNSPEPHFCMSLTCFLGRLVTLLLLKPGLALSLFYRNVVAFFPGPIWWLEPSRKSLVEGEVREPQKNYSPLARADLIATLPFSKHCALQMHFVWGALAADLSCKIGSLALCGAWGCWYSGRMMGIAVRGVRPVFSWLG